MSDLRGDMGELKDETIRTRRRLHDAEGALGMLVNQEKVRRQTTIDRQRRMEGRISLLTFVVLVATLIEPFLYHAAGGG